MKYIVIGASAAGLACAEEIRKTDKDGSIKVFTNEEYLPYSRPSISYYLKGVVKESNIYLRKPSDYASRNIEIITGSCVNSIDREKKEIKVGRKTFDYDKLCIATGSYPFIPEMGNVRSKENALTFLDLAAVKKVKAKAGKNTRAVVIGAGLIGMKAAEGLSKICKSVEVVELAPRILPSILDEKASEFVKKYIEEKGNIIFHLGNTVVKTKSKGKRVSSVILKNGEELDCDLLILAVGVRPDVKLAEKAGLEVNRGIVTNPETMQTSDKDIYAAGDCALSTDIDKSKKIIALWVNAVKQGKTAGSQMAGGNEKGGITYAINAIDFYGLRIATAGLINAEGSQYKDMVKSDKGSYKRLIFEGNHLVGFVLINSSENAGIYTSMIENKDDISRMGKMIDETASLFLFDKKTREKRLKGEVG